mmetsp:Transcript_40836/g.107936  ORF Transcript_40836/g.107936 Transcript_40836/m.107936 type:complete len:266 (-) Transcript_40836:57-854(-)
MMNPAFFVAPADRSRGYRRRAPREYVPGGCLPVSLRGRAQSHQGQARQGAPAPGIPYTPIPLRHGTAFVRGPETLQPGQQALSALLVHCWHHVARIEPCRGRFSERTVLSTTPWPVCSLPSTWLKSATRDQLHAQIRLCLRPRRRQRRQLSSPLSSSSWRGQRQPWRHRQPPQRGPVRDRSWPPWSPVRPRLRSQQLLWRPLRPHPLSLRLSWRPLRRRRRLRLQSSWRPLRLRRRLNLQSSRRPLRPRRLSLQSSWPPLRLRRL